MATDATAAHRQSSPSAPPLEIGLRSDKGPHRQINEDTVGYFVPADRDPRRAKGAIFVVADGMGGHRAGEVASQQAVKTVIAHYYRHASSDVNTALIWAFRAANRLIYEQAQADPTKRGMGTTLVAAVVLGRKVYIANVGDSRAYFLNGGRLTRLTRDHSWVEEQVRAGVLTREEAQRHPQRNVVTRALGSKPTVKVDIVEREWRGGDTLFLCTDGLSEALPARQIAHLLRDSSPQAAANQLVTQAIARGSQDNVSALVVRAAPGRADSGFSPYLLAGLVALIGLCAVAALALGLFLKKQDFVLQDPVAAPHVAPLRMPPQEASDLDVYVTAGELDRTPPRRSWSDPTPVELRPTQPGIFLVGQVQEATCGDGECSCSVSMANETYQVRYRQDLLDKDLDGHQVRILGLWQPDSRQVRALRIEMGSPWWAWWPPPWKEIYRDDALQQPVWVYGTVDQDPYGLLAPGESGLSSGEQVLARGQWAAEKLDFQPERVYRLREKTYYVPITP